MPTAFVPKGENERGNGDEVRTILFLKRFTVFNVAQCDGLPERFAAAPEPVPLGEQHQPAVTLIAATGADFRIGGAEAFYVPALDYIQVPPPATFFGPASFAATALHETAH